LVDVLAGVLLGTKRLSSFEVEDSETEEPEKIGLARERGP
jgi:hypothetical protein